MIHPYFDYYNTPIQQNASGLKLVLGGTGLGKTSAIVDVVEQAATSRKYIYCANRIQLLNEMAERLDLRSIGYVHLKNDTDVLVDILNDSQSTAEFHALLQQPIIQRYIDHIHRTTGLLLSIPDVIQACDAIRAGAGVRGV
jgi:hypothetical protein